MALRVGMLGTYDHVNLFADPAAGREDVEFVGLYEPDESRAAPLVEKFGVRSWPSRDALLDEGLDAVGVFSPFHNKADDIVACMDRGLHVFADKPAAISAEGLTRLRQAVELHPEVVLTMGLVFRFTPVHRRLRELVRAGDVGDVVAIDARRSYRLRRPTRPEFMFDEKLSGGEWVELAVHDVDYVRWLTGGEYLWVAATHGGATSPDEPFQDHGEGLFRLTGGVTACIAHDRLTPESGPDADSYFHVYGSEGRIGFGRQMPLTLWTHSAEPTEITDLPDWDDLFGNFLGAIAGEEELVVGPDDVLKVTEAVLAAYASSAAGGERVEIGG